MVAGVDTADVAEGFHDAAVAIGEGLAAIGTMISAVGRAVARALRLIRIFLQKTIGYSFLLLGRRTTHFANDPKEQSFKEVYPGKEWMGFATLCILPVVPISMLASVTVVPLLANSARGFWRGSKFLVNAALPPSMKFIDPTTAPRAMTKLQHAYATPGYFLAAVVGVTIALPLAIIRGAVNFVRHTFATAKWAIKAFINVALYGTDRPKYSLVDNELDEESKKRHWAKRFLAGVLGLVIGGVVGGLAFLAIGGYRLVKSAASHSFKSCSWMLSKTVHLAMYGSKWAKDSVSSDNRSVVERCGKGMLGIVVGAVIAVPLFVIVGAIRTVVSVVKNTFATTCLSLKWALNFVLPRKKIAATESEEQGLIEGSAGKGVTQPYYFSLTNNIKPHQKVIGVLGFVLGGVALAAIAGTFVVLGRTIINTCITGLNCVKKVLNKVLPSKTVDAKTQDYFTVGEDKRTKASKAFGIVGMIFGGFALLTAGAIVAGVAVVIARAVKNAWITSVRCIKQALNIFLPNKKEQVGESEVEKSHFGVGEDTRSKGAKRFGIAGIICGGFIPLAIIAVVGAAVVTVVRTIKNAYLTNSYWLRNLWNRILPNKKDENGQEKPYFQHEDTRSKGAKRFGIAGILCGGFIPLVLIGGLGALAIMTVRGFSNTFKSAWWTIKAFVKGALYKSGLDTKISLADDRKKSERFAYGFAGLILGGVVGVAAFAVVGVARAVVSFIANTFKTTCLAFKWTMNLLAPKKKFIESDDAGSREVAKPYFSLANNLKPHQKVIGVLGFVLGGVVLAAIAGTFVVLGRTIINTCVSGLRFVKKALNKVLPDKTVDSQAQDYFAVGEDKRTKASKAFGIVGMVLGGFALVGATALVAGVAVVIARAVKNAWITSTRCLKQALNIFLPNKKENEVEKNHFNVDEDTRSKGAKRFGIAGIICGGFIPLALIAVVGAVAIALTRVVTNSIKSFKLALSNTLGRAFAKNPIEVAENNAKRHWLQHALGLPGLILGGVIGVGVAVVMTVARTLINGVLTGAMLAAKFLNKLLPSHKQIPADDKRNDFNKKHGLVGFCLGGFAITAVACVVGAVAIGLAYAIVDTAKSFWRALKISVKGALFNTQYGKGGTKEIATADDRLDSNGKEKKGRIYGTGLIGGVLGTVVGAVMGVTILAARCLYQTACSFKSLSCSLINWARDKKSLYGIAADNRSGKAKVVGALGYVAAAALVAPIAFAYKLIWKVALPIVAGVVSLVFIAPFKLLARAFNACCSGSYGRLSGNDDYDRRFKQLKNCLGFSGRFNKGLCVHEVPPNKGYNQAIGAFVRRCVTLNAKTPTERLLDALFKVFTHLSDEAKEQFFVAGNQSFNKIVSDVKSHYTEGLMVTEEDVKRCHREIDRTANFVRDYMLAEGQALASFVVPELYEERAGSVEIFAGPRRNREHEAEHGNAEEQARLVAESSSSLPRSSAAPAGAQESGLGSVAQASVVASYGTADPLTVPPPANAATAANAAS